MSLNQRDSLLLRLTKFVNSCDASMLIESDGLWSRLLVSFELAG